jgi:hypothetical protein
MYACLEKKGYLAFFKSAREKASREIALLEKDRKDL